MSPLGGGPVSRWAWRMPRRFGEGDDDHVETSGSYLRIGVWRGQPSDAVERLRQPAAGRRSSLGHTALGETLPGDGPGRTAEAARRVPVPGWRPAFPV